MVRNMQRFIYSVRPSISLWYMWLVDGAKKSHKRLCAYFAQPFCVLGALDLL
jgi:hypothetical protein